MVEKNNEKLSDVDKIINEIKDYIGKIEEPIKEEVGKKLEKILRKKMNDLEMYIKDFDIEKIHGYLFLLIFLSSTNALMEFYKIETERYYKKDTLEFKQKLTEIIEEKFENDIDRIFIEPVRMMKEMERKM